MKKYKLIKQYPGSGVVGTITELTEKMNPAYFTDNPDFYEEVVEKDYEILISRVVPQEILSVKRLSDGEIFTVGDRAMTQGSRGGHSIRQFRIKQKCNVRTPVPGIFAKDGIDRIWIDWEEGCGGNWLESTEKIIEKDYEIISYVAKDNPTNITTKRRGAHLHEEYWTIHKIKRLSDGEIFTVGNKITGYHEDARSIQTIRICTYTGRIRLEQSGGYTDLMYATKVKQPISLTHDGKDIFEGDTVWWVNKKTFCSDYFVPTPSVIFFSDINVYFLTQEAASDYISRNKPRLSIEDCFKILQKSFLYGNGFEKEIEKYIRKNNK